MDFKKYLGKHVLDNVEDVIVPDVDLVDDLGNMLNVYFPLEQFEDAPEKLLRTGLLVFYDVDRSVTDILTTAMVLEEGKKERICSICEKKEEEKIPKLEATITLSPNPVTLVAGLSQKITVSKLMDGDKVVSYESSNAGIAAVNSNGLITGKNAGSARWKKTMFIWPEESPEAEQFFMIPGI